MSLLYLKLGISFQILTPSAMSTALAVWPGVYCLMGLYSSISLSNTGPQTIQASRLLPFLFFFSSCSYIFPFVKLASYALMISSKSAFIPFKLFLLISLSILLSFFFLSLSGPVQVYGVLEIILGSRACGSPTCWSFAQSHANCPVLSMLLQVSLGVSQSVP